jgi:hypothetical protein
MSAEVDLALSKAEAIEVRAILEVVANSPQVWREADGWHADAMQAVADRLTQAITL